MARTGDKNTPRDKSAKKYIGPNGERFGWHLVTDAEFALLSRRRAMAELNGDRAASKVVPFPASRQRDEQRFLDHYRQLPKGEQDIMNALLRVRLLVNQADEVLNDYFNGV